MRHNNTDKQPSVILEPATDLWANDPESAIPPSVLQNLAAPLQQKLILYLQRAQTVTVKVTPFGLGLDTLLLIEQFCKHAPKQARLTIIASESNPFLKSTLQQWQARFPSLSQQYAYLLAHYPPLIKGTFAIRWQDPRVVLLLRFGEAHATSGNASETADLAITENNLDFCAPTKSFSPSDKSQENPKSRIAVVGAG